MRKVSDGRGVAVRTKRCSCGIGLASRCEFIRSQNLLINFSKFNKEVFIMLKKAFNYYVAQPFKEIRKPKNIAMCSMLIALSVLSSYILTLYPTQYLKISVSFIFVSIAAMKYGPAVAAIIAAFSDIISFIAKPMGAYIPFLTLTCALGGLVAGFFLYKNKSQLWRIITLRVLLLGIVSTLLDTYILSSILSDFIFTEMMISRAVKNLVALPIEIALMIIVLNLVKKIQKDN